MTAPATRPEPRRWTIGPDSVGQRVDNFLLGCLKGVPRSRVYRILRRGEVRINGGRVRPGYRLRSGDELRLPPVRTSPEGAPPRVPAPVLERLAAAVLVEDRHYIVVDKPAGMSVHGGSGVSYGVIEAMRLMRAGTLELAHRLDRDTSGCLVLARSRAALEAVHRALRARGAEKRYLALVRGRMTGAGCRVDAPLRKNILRGGERLVEVGAGGKDAETRLRPVERYGGASLVEARLMTGRTHQIRVHCAHLGHPIAGDRRYGDQAFSAAMAGWGLRRLFLHAAAIELPVGTATLAAEAPLPPELAAVLERLRAGGLEDHR